MAERDKIWEWGGVRVIWVRTGVASTGWWATCHTKPEALNVFFDKVTKVWMIYLKSERDRISNTRFFLFFRKWWFVDVSSLCRPFSYFFFLYFFLTFFFNFVSGISLLSLLDNFFFWFFWGGKSEQDRHSITKSSRTRVSNPQEIPIFYPAQPHVDMLSRIPTRATTCSPSLIAGTEKHLRLR